MTFPTKRAIWALFPLLGISILTAQDVAGPANPGAIPKDKIRESDVAPIPSPFDGFLALSKLTKDNPVDWNEVIRSGSLLIAKPADYKGKVASSLALGAKVTDALVAIQARNLEELSNSSRIIEALAANLGVEKARLGRAEKVRSLATEGDWLGVFLELGFLQTDIINELADDKRSDERALITAAGWLQGSSLVSSAIVAHYSPAASSLLREPLLLAKLNDDLSKSSKEVTGHPAVVEIQGILKSIHAIVDIPRDGTLTKEQVQSVAEKGKAARNLIKKTNC